MAGTTSASGQRLGPSPRRLDRRSFDTASPRGQPGDAKAAGGSSSGTRRGNGGDSFRAGTASSRSRARTNNTTTGSGTSNDGGTERSSGSTSRRSTFSGGGGGGTRFSRNRGGGRQPKSAWSEDDLAEAMQQPSPLAAFDPGPVSFTEEEVEQLAREDLQRRMRTLASDLEKLGFAEESQSLPNFGGGVTSASRGNRGSRRGNDGGTSSARGSSGNTSGHNPTDVDCEVGDRFLVLRKVAVRAGPQLSSSRLATLSAGEAISVLETWRAPDGQLRVRCAAGWTSIVSRDGTTLMERDRANITKPRNQHQRSSTSSASRWTAQPISPTSSQPEEKAPSPPRPSVVATMGDDTTPDSTALAPPMGTDGPNDDFSVSQPAAAPPLLSADTVAITTTKELPRGPREAGESAVTTTPLRLIPLPTEEPPVLPPPIPAPASTPAGYALEDTPPPLHLQLQRAATLDNGEEEDMSFF